MLYIGSDHGGFELKEDLKKMLKAEKVPFVDVGPKKFVADDDYPVYTKKAAMQVSKNPQKNRAVLICRSGHGVCIAANKFKNVRAALCWNEEVAQASRNDDDTNVLCLPSDYISPGVAMRTLTFWLKTPFSGQPRHLRRIKEVLKLEK